MAVAPAFRILKKVGQSTEYLSGTSQKGVTQATPSAHVPIGIFKSLWIELRQGPPLPSPGPRTHRDFQIPMDRAVGLLEWAPSRGPSILSPVRSPFLAFGAASCETSCVLGVLRDKNVANVANGVL